MALLVIVPGENKELVEGTSHRFVTDRPLKPGEHFNIFVPNTAWLGVSETVAGPAVQQIDTPNNEFFVHTKPIPGPAPEDEPLNIVVRDATGQIVQENDGSVVLRQQIIRIMQADPSGGIGLASEPVPSSL